MILVLLGSLCALWFGIQSHLDNQAGAIDFKAYYFPTRTVIHGSDPYNPIKVLREYQAEPTSRLDDQLVRTVATHDPYPPTAFLLLIPIASLPFRAAWTVWTILNVGSLLWGVVLIWDLGADYSPQLSGALIAFLLIDSESLIASGNDACIAIGLCCIAVSSILRQKRGGFGVLCLAASILLKPQDAGLVWLYLMATGKGNRRFSMQTLIVGIVVGLPSMLWTYSVAPNWPHEVATNLGVYTAPGGINDPSPTSGATPGSLVNLQVVFSLLKNEPLFYNLATFLICGGLILALLTIAARSNQSRRQLLLGLASLCALVILAVYHRRFEAELLTLAVPGCAMLWSERGRLSNLALGFTGSAILLGGDGTWVFFSNVIEGLHLNHPHIFLALQCLLVTLPAPIALVAVGIFFLRIYAQRSQGPELIETRES